MENIAKKLSFGYFFIFCGVLKLSPRFVFGGALRTISRLAALAARVEYSRTLPSLLACKTRPCHALHPPLGAVFFAPTDRTRMGTYIPDCRGD